jgi:AcrR family transcriptional regulator
MAEEKTPDTAQVILDSAERLFLEKGFALTSTTEIARNAGCNQALVHYYYRTKERLFEAIFEMKVRLFIRSFMEIGKRDIPFTEKLREKIEAHFDILAKNQRLPFLIMNELLTNNSRIQSVREKIENLGRTVLDQFESELSVEIEAGRIRPIAPLDLVLTILSMNVALFLARPILNELLGLDDASFKELVARRKKENVTFILNGLKP